MAVGYRRRPNVFVSGALGALAGFALAGLVIGALALPMAA
jgi:hypothetical protein